MGPMAPRPVSISSSSMGPPARVISSIRPGNRVSPLVYVWFASRPRAGAAGAHATPTASKEMRGAYR